MVIEIHVKSKGVGENWHVEERTIRTDASLVGLLELRINVPPCLRSWNQYLFCTELIIAQPAKFLILVIGYVVHVIGPSQVRDALVDSFVAREALFID